MTVGPDFLLEHARAAYQNAHAPLSGFRVGAAVLSRSGHVYRAANVELAGVPAACAERNALAAAIAAEGAELAIEMIAVAAASGGPCAPCGVCRQAIYSYQPDIQVAYIGHDRTLRVREIEELLPEGFRLADARLAEVTL